jgi:hypothetical protein
MRLRVTIDQQTQYLDSQGMSRDTWESVYCQEMLETEENDAFHKVREIAAVVNSLPFNHTPSLKGT